MPESAKDAIGQGKEAAGEALGNDDLKREGQTEQAGEKAKAGIDKAVDAIKGVFGGDKKDA